MLKTQLISASSPKLESSSPGAGCGEYLLKASPPPFSKYYLMSNIFSTIPVKKELPLLVKCSNLSNAKASSFDLVKKEELFVKKVKFADEIGLPLFKLRKFYESTYEPPPTCGKFTNTEAPTICGKLTNTEWKEGNGYKFEMLFKQPAADYMGFRHKLDTLNLSLENVIIKQGSFYGTVKVKNVSYEKHVFVRFTWDDWETYQDVSTNYLPRGLFLCNSEFDTFSFEIILSDEFRKPKLDCCVCMRCGEMDFWDNNNGSNYTILFSDESNVKGSLDLCNAIHVTSLDKSQKILIPYW